MVAASTVRSMQLSLARLPRRPFHVFKRQRDSPSRRDYAGVIFVKIEGSKVEGSLRAAAMRRKLISRLINYRSAGRLTQGDVSVVKHHLRTASAVFFERGKRVHIPRRGNINTNFLARLTSLENSTESPARRRHFAEKSFEKIRVSLTTTTTRRRCRKT